MEDIQILELVDSQPPIPYFVEENEDEERKLVTWFCDEKKTSSLQKIGFKVSRSLFHQHFMSSFLARKCFAQLFYVYL